MTEILGQGGMGSVYRAVDENLGVEVALKENLFMSDEYARQFHREAVILATLRHPNLPRVTDHFVIEGQGQYLVMDFIEGEDLRQRMDREHNIPEADVVIIGAAICDALTYLEERTQPIIHRDIKPGNVKITPTGQIYLVDFGLAKLIQSGEATTTGARAMTPGYSPPEQYGTARTDHRSDLFSLGATLYAALTGYIPEDALSRAMDQVPLTPIRHYNQKISQKLSDVIEKALAVRPDERYQSALQFKNALLNSQSGLVVEDGQYWVEPPPEEIEKNHARWSELLNEAFDQSGKNGQAANKNGMAQSKKVYGSEKFNFIWFALVSFGVLLLFAVILINVFDPELFHQGVSMVFPSVITFTPPDTPDITQTSTTSMSAGIKFTSTVAPPTRVYPTITMVETLVAAVPSLTHTPLPTMVGGGTGEIAFVSDRSGVFQIWIMDTKGGNLRQLTDLPEGACQPDWSPDGKRLVFISPCDSNQDAYPGSGLFVIDYDGSGLSPISTTPGGDYDPDWSPDGNFIAFTSLRVTGRPRIYILNLIDNSVTMLSQPYSRDSDPSWSPDGAQIAYVSRKDGPSDIWIMSANGENQRVYTRSGGKINSHPVWSMDGEVILFIQKESLGAISQMVAASYVEGEYSEYAFDLGPVPVRDANYSPDGLWLVFESWPDGRNHDIYILTVSGAIRTRLTDYERVDFDPVWRPGNTW
ncbi:MAG: serine/threonine-protein kinase [Anaerolineales bacterium]|nr:serine/threonine-protein kinase [Anaerolineales bacterium]